MKLILLSFAISLYSAAVFSNELCERAGIHSLQLAGKTSDSGRDACKVSRDGLNEVEEIRLKDLIKIHQEVADLFRVSVTDLFTKPLSVEIREYVFGPMISTAGAKSINMGSFPGDNFSINIGVYLHELGHVLGYANNPLLPIMLGDLNQSKLFSESFADLLALSLHGNIITPMSEKPNCLDRIRYITTFQTYNYPQEYFESFSEARIRKCCDSLERSSRDQRVLNLCQVAKDWFSSDINLSYPFDPSNLGSIDDHQLGIPVISFLKSFSEKTHRPLKAVFEEMLFPKSDAAQEVFTCTLTRDSNILLEKQIGLYTVKTVLHNFYKTLNTKDAEIYRALFEKHALEKGFEFVKDDHLKNAKIKMSENFECKKDCNISCK